MKRITPWALVGAALVAAIWLGVSVGQSSAQEETDVGTFASPMDYPGRFQIVYISAPGAGRSNDQQTILLDTSTGKTWGMRKWDHWVELSRKKAPPEKNN